MTERYRLVKLSGHLRQQVPQFHKWSFGVLEQMARSEHFDPDELLSRREIERDIVRDPNRPALKIALQQPYIRRQPPCRS